MKFIAITLSAVVLAAVTLATAPAYATDPGDIGHVLQSPGRAGWTCREDSFSARTRMPGATSCRREWEASPRAKAAKRKRDERGAWENVPDLFR